MLGGELRLLQFAHAGVAEEGVHLAAEVLEPLAAIARRPLGDEFRHRVLERRVLVMQPLEGDERRNQRARPCSNSTPGVSRKSSELRSFFSGTTRFSRKYWATTGAGTPCAS